MTKSSHLGVRILALTGLALAIAFAAWAARSAYAGDDAATAAVAAPGEEQIRDWVRQLGAEDPKVRNQASEELRKAGAAALPALKEATKSSDAEVAWRAGSLAREIETSRKQTEKAAADAETRADGRKDARIGDEDEEEAPPRRGGRWRVIAPGRGQVQLHTTVSGEVDGSKYRLEREGNGRVKLEVTPKDGETRTFEADSVEEFRKKFPEQAKEYGIEDADGGLSIAIGGGRLGRLLGGAELSDEEIERFEKQMQEMQKRFQKLLDGRMKDFDLDRLRKQLEEDEGDLGDIDGEITRLFRQLGRALGGEAQENGDEDAHQDPAPAPKPRADAGSARLGAKASDVDDALRYQLDLADDAGAVLSEVPADSAAARVGLRQFDVVTDVNGAAVKGKWEFRRLLSDALAAGGKTRLGIIRHGKKQTVEFSPADLESPPPPKPDAPDPGPK